VNEKVKEKQKAYAAFSICTSEEEQENILFLFSFYFPVLGINSTRKASSLTIPLDSPVGTY